MAVSSRSPSQSSSQSSSPKAATTTTTDSPTIIFLHSPSSTQLTPTAATAAAMAAALSSTRSKKRRAIAYTAREKAILLGMIVCVMGIFHKTSLFHIEDMTWTTPESKGVSKITNNNANSQTARQLNLPTFSPQTTAVATDSSSSSSSSSSIINLPPARASTVQPDPHRHAILIPYRNRTFHLTKFLEYMRPYLQHHFPDDVFTAYVVEQDDEGLFNRGWLTNVGLHEIQKIEPQTTCITLHDVDLIPNGTSHVPYTSCVDRPIHLANKMENFNWGIPYIQYCGGITALSLNHWQEINGMSNDYQGWGGEDDDLWHRIRLNGLLMDPQPDPKSYPRPVRPKPGEGHFRTISQSEEHHAQKKVHENQKITQKMLEAMWRGSDRWMTEGLNDVYYMLSGTNITTLSTEPMNMPDWKDRPLHVPKPKITVSSVINNKTAKMNATAAVVAASAEASGKSYNRSAVTLLRHTNWGTAKANVRKTTKDIALTTNVPMDQNNKNDVIPNIATEAPYSKPLGLGIDKLVHIKAIPMRGRNQLPPTHKLATDEPVSPVLELVDIPYTGGDLLTRAAARSNIVWGACHWYVRHRRRHGKEEEKDPYDCSHAEYSGDFQHGFTLEGSYAQAQFPWHMPPSAWHTDPLEGAVRFTVVKHPYTRALDFFRTWYDVQHRDTRSNVTEAEYLQQREQPDQVNSFLRMYLNQTEEPWTPPKWMRGTIDMTPMRDVFAQMKSTSYIKHILKYEDLEKAWRDLAMQYNYTNTGIDEQINRLLEERKKRQSQASAWLQPNDLELETIDLINFIYPDDFKIYPDYEKLPGTGKKHKYKHPRTKHHKPSLAMESMEMIAIPYTGAVGSLTRAAGRVGIVWGACHFEAFEQWECPRNTSGNFYDSVKVIMNGVTGFEAPWNVELKLWPRNPFDVALPNTRKSKTFTVVRNPYDRAISFYRHMFDREHGYHDGLFPMQDEDALFDPSSIEMNEYLIKREDAERMNAWLQNYFYTMHHPHRPLGMELIPQHRYTFRVENIVKYESLTSGLQKHIGKLQGKSIDLQLFQEFETKRENYTKDAKTRQGPRMLDRSDLSSMTVTMVNEIYAMDFYKWYRSEKRLLDAKVSTSSHWKQPQHIPGQRRVGRN